MSDTLITVILGFNIILLLLYFAMKFHKQSTNKDREIHDETVEEEKKDPTRNDN